MHLCPPHEASSQPPAPRASHRAASFWVPARLVLCGQCELCVGRGVIEPVLRVALEHSLVDRTSENTLRGRTLSHVTRLGRQCRSYRLGGRHSQLSGSESGCASQWHLPFRSQSPSGRHDITAVAWAHRRFGRSCPCCPHCGGGIYIREFNLQAHIRI